MARRPQFGDPESLRRKLAALLDDFEEKLSGGDLREQVRSLVPAVYALRDLGCSLITEGGASSARDRILCYLRRYSKTVVPGDELAVVSGISEYARRVRELRVEYGWPIYSGATARGMLREELEGGTGDLFAAPLPVAEILEMKTDDYILMGEQDRDAAHRWHVANDIRKRRDLSTRDRILEYLRSNVGKPVTGEELRYVAGGAQSWPRRTRELRTEQGWPVATRSSGRPELPVGDYVLQADRQSPPHDRSIPDPVRVEVLERDGFRCRCCGWAPSKHVPGDRRSLLELHHVDHHGRGGSNEAGNLLTLCDVHHDAVHKLNLEGWDELHGWLSSACG